MLSKLMAAALAASLLTLAGCAQMDTKAERQQSATEAVAETAAATPAPDDQLVIPEPVVEAQVAIPNPAVVEFDPKSVQLDSDAQALVARLIERAGRADKIVIKGYSDRRLAASADNAREIAIARAVQIRNEFLKNGISSKNIRIRYTTEQEKNMATVDLGEEPLRVENSGADKRRN